MLGKMDRHVYGGRLRSVNKFSVRIKTLRVTPLQLLQAYLALLLAVLVSQQKFRLLKSIDNGSPGTTEPTGDLLMGRVQLAEFRNRLQVDFDWRMASPAAFFRFCHSISLRNKSVGDSDSF